MAGTLQRAVGTPVRRIEGVEKVTGRARYAVEHRRPEMTYAWVVQARGAPGEVTSVATAEALARPGLLAVVTHENAPRLAEVDDRELAVLQGPSVGYRGQIVAAVVADSLETAREAAGLVHAEIATRELDVTLRADHPGLYAPDSVNAGYETDTAEGDVDAGLAEAATTVDLTYTTPAFHNNPMEPHATLAWWEDGRLLVHDSNQGPPAHRATLAQAFGLAPDMVRVTAEHVGGGFGSKGTPHANLVLTALLAKAVGRPVKLAVTRQQMFAFTGYRTPTIQRMRLGADAGGRLTALSHEGFVQTSTLGEFAEQTAVPSRTMYATPNRRTSHRVVALDVPTPSWMRAPGECPGMFALECAMDELAVAAGLDPIELRVRNETPIDPEKGKRFTSRNLVACLREGAERFGWAERHAEPRTRRAGTKLLGLGVASAAYPAMQRPTQATARADRDGRFLVRVGAVDIGTGARTVLTQLAADALGAPVERVTVKIGDSGLPPAPVAGGSAGTSSWGWAVVKACEDLRRRVASFDGRLPAEGVVVHADTEQDIADREELGRCAFGAHFAEVAVDEDTGEIAVRRMLGVFAAGRIVNPMTARSQFLGGMTMGLGMALMEGSVMDRRFGDFLNHDLAQYHVPVSADVTDVEATWLDEHDTEVNPIGTKGIGEIGIVGSAAAIANAVFNATGVRVRDLPIRLDDVLGATA